jgi:hypothetical protein
MLSADAEHANAPRVAANAAAQTARVRPQRGFQRRGSFARTFFGLFGF